MSRHCQLSLFGSFSSVYGCVYPCCYSERAGSSDGDLVDEVQALWLFWRMQKDLFSSLRKWWDAGKEKIKGLADRFSSYKKKAFLEARSLLLNLPSHLQGKIDYGVLSCHDAYVST